MSVNVALMLWKMDVRDVRVTKRCLSEAITMLVVTVRVEVKLAMRESTLESESVIEAIEVNETRDVRVAEIVVMTCERVVRLIVIPNSRAMASATVVGEVRLRSNVSVVLIEVSTVAVEKSETNWEKVLEIAELTVVVDSRLSNWLRERPMDAVINDVVAIETR
jgi:hypothetical protein